jgi:hypothetical protein
MEDAGNSIRWLTASTMTNDNISTPQQVNQNPKIWDKQGGYYCVRLLTYAYGQHINVLNHCVYVYYGFGEQFEVAVSLQPWRMKSFQLHKWPRTPTLSQVVLVWV